MRLHIAFRCDSSTAIGTGHLFRCLGLATEARHQGFEVFFICRAGSGSQHEQAQMAGFPVHLLDEAKSDVSEEVDALQTLEVIRARSAKVDWIVCDHYGIGRKWENLLRASGPRLLLIDDLADKSHDVDILVNANFFVDMAKRYESLVSGSCRLLLGPEYGFIRKEFQSAREHADTRPRLDPDTLRVHVFFGGVDLPNETQKILEAAASLRRDFHFTCVLGSANPHKDGIKKACSRLEYVDVLENPPDYALLLARSDLAIGAGGTSMWERCFLGIPTVSVTIASNQEEINKNLANQGYCVYLGTSETVKSDDYLDILQIMRRCTELRNFLRLRSMQLVDGNGLKRIVAQLLELS